MKEKFKPVTDESPMMIVSGILVFYVLIAGFIFYLYLKEFIRVCPPIIFTWTNCGHFCFF